MSEKPTPGLVVRRKLVEKKKFADLRLKETWSTFGSPNFRRNCFLLTLPAVAMGVLTLLEFTGCKYLFIALCTLMMLYLAKSLVFALIRSALIKATVIEWFGGEIACMVKDLEEYDEQLNNIRDRLDQHNLVEYTGISIYRHVELRVLHDILVELRDEFDSVELPEENEYIKWVNDEALYVIQGLQAGVDVTPNP